MVAGIRPRLVPLLLGGAAVLALVAVVAHFGEAEHFLALVRQAQPVWLVLALGLQLCTYGADSLLWRSVISRRGPPPPFHRLYELSVVALFTSGSVPSAGIAGTWIVLRVLQDWGVARSTAVATVLIDIVAYYVAYGLFVAAALAVLWRHHDLSPVVLAMAAVIAVLAVAMGAGALRLSSGRMRVPKALAKVGFVARALSELSTADPELVRSPRLLARGLLLRCATFTLDTTTLWACLAALGTHTGPGPALTAFVLGSLARTVGIVPAGLGTFEAAVVGGFALFGVRVEPALAAVLLFRGLSFWLPLGPGLWFSRRVARREAHA